MCRGQELVIWALLASLSVSLAQQGSFELFDIDYGLFGIFCSSSPTLNDFGVMMMLSDD
jgi:hypothetical protein